MRTRGDASVHPVRRYYQHNYQPNKNMDTYKIIKEIDRNKKTMDTYNTIEEIRKLKTCRAVRAYYKSLPRELQDSPRVLLEVRRKRREIRWVRFYRWLFSL